MGKVTDACRPSRLVRATTHRRDLVARGLFALAFLAALALLMQLPHSPVTGAALRFKLPPPTQVVPLQDRPLPDPSALVPLAPQSARDSNALVSIEPPMQPAPPFRLAPTIDDATRDRATDCLAAAQWYEAGDDPSGERAVAQVVLNRVRIPRSRAPYAAWCSRDPTARRDASSPSHATDRWRAAPRSPPGRARGPLRWRRWRAP